MEELYEHLDECIWSRIYDDMDWSIKRIGCMARRWGKTLSFKSHLSSYRTKRIMFSRNDFHSINKNLLQKIYLSIYLLTYLPVYLSINQNSHMEIPYPDASKLKTPKSPKKFIKFFFFFFFFFFKKSKRSKKGEKQTPPPPLSISLSP